MDIDFPVDGSKAAGGAYPAMASPLARFSLSAISRRVTRPCRAAERL